MLDKTTIKILCIACLILIIPFSFAAEEYVLGPGEIEAEELRQAQESIQQYGTLSEKISAFMVKNVQNLEQVASFFDGKISEQTTTLIIIIVISNLSTLGIAFAIYLFLKSKKLI